MLSDEEKKAIEYLKQNNIVEIQYDNYGLESIHRVGIDEKQIILNLIEKQSKEIEELKNADLTTVYLNGVYDGSKEIEELKNADLTTVYLNGVYDGEKKVKDKIKAKIEDLKENSNGDDFNLTNVIMLFKSLLEKE